MHRKHRSKPKPPAQPSSRVVMMDEVQTEVAISRKNMAKLVFHESDGGSSSDN